MTNNDAHSVDVYVYAPKSKISSGGSAATVNTTIGGQVEVD